MAITLTLKVTIEGFAAEASDRGNYSARGITFEALDVKGCEASQLSIWTPRGGNGGGISFLTKEKGLVAKLNNALAARGSASDELVRLRAERAELEALKAELEALKAAKRSATAKKPSSEAARLKAELEALKASM